MRNQLLRDSDWASMAHGLEVRVPLVDAVLLKRIAAAAPSTGSLRAMASKTSLALSPSRQLPAAVVAKAKTGFTTPIALWLQAESLSKSKGAAPQHKVRPASHWSRQWAERLAVA